MRRKRVKFHIVTIFPNFPGPFRARRDPEGVRVWKIEILIHDLRT